jgi:hypothetical protein
MQQAFPIFMHIEHTGGTTLQDVVMRQYGHAHVRLIYYRNNRLEQFITLTENERAKYHALLGHVYYGVHRHIPAPHTTYIALLRHPADRVVSSYYYMARQTHALGRSIAEGRLPLEEFIRTHVHENTRLQLARVVGGTDEDIQKYRIILPDDAVAIAKTHIEQHFALVGLVERYDESLLMMQRTLGWQKPVTYLRRNTTAKRPRVADLPQSTRDLLAEATAQEQQLYDWVKARFESQVVALGDEFTQQVAQFKAENVRYAARMEKVEKVKDTLRPAWRRLKRALNRD